tara:strand:- start:935 stop:1432 length:498 start_codon:yes stop_codon:yes gene_type:complete
MKIVNRQIMEAVKKEYPEQTDDCYLKLVALAEHLDIGVDDITLVDINQEETEFHLYKEEYLVCDDFEADEICSKEIQQGVWAFNTDFLVGFMPRFISEKMVDACKEQCEDSNEDILQLIDAGEGIDKFVETAIGYEGRGHYLDLYSGNEVEITVSDKTFYIYRLL